MTAREDIQQALNTCEDSYREFIINYRELKKLIKRNIGIIHNSSIRIKNQKCTCLDFGKCTACYMRCWGYLKRGIDNDETDKFKYYRETKKLRRYGLIKPE